MADPNQDTIIELLNKHFKYAKDDMDKSFQLFVIKGTVRQMEEQVAQLKETARRLEKELEAEGKNHIKQILEEYFKKPNNSARA